MYDAMNRLWSAPACGSLSESAALIAGSTANGTYRSR